MFSTKHYVPVLKGKEGEFKAIEKTSSAATALMTPIIELMDFVPLIITEEKLAKRRKPLPTFESDLRNDIKSIIACWKDKGDIFIDVHLIPPPVLYTVGGAYTSIIFEELYNNGVRPIPVVYPDSDNRLFDDAKLINKKYDCGAAIRLKTEELVTIDFLQDALNKLQMHSGDIDLIIDLESIIGKNIDTLVQSVSYFINNTLFNVEAWRTMTVVSGAFPVDLGDYDPLTEGDIDRNDWLFWKKLIAIDLKRKPTFGDYSIAHPEIQVFKDFPNVSASIRYTTENTWKIMRGQGTKKRGWEQIRDRCNELIKLPIYDKADFSWADDYIQKCAEGKVGTGGAKKWRQIANNRHFEKVTNLLSTFPGI